MSKKLWFGIPGKKMAYLPAPNIESSMGNNYYFESIAFENGGADVRRSRASHKSYDFQVFSTMEEADGVNEYQRFYAGLYGDGLFYFSDPYVQKLNVVPTVWASPGLIEQGWPNISVVKPSFVDTPANAFNLPARSAVFDVESTDEVVGERFYATIPIPPEMTLYLGATGEATGGANVSVIPVLADGSDDSVEQLTLSGFSSDVRMGDVYDGATYQAVKVFLPTTGTVGSVLTLASIMGQLFDSKFTPELTKFHVPGEGHTGLEFANEVVAESYVYIDPPRKGVSFRMLEVGAWR